MNELNPARELLALSAFVMAQVADLQESAWYLMIRGLPDHAGLADDEIWSRAREMAADRMMETVNRFGEVSPGPSAFLEAVRKKAEAMRHDRSSAHSDLSNVIPLFGPRPKRDE